MASAGTARFPAPAVVFQVARSHALAGALVGFNALALANLVAWFFWSAPPSSSVITASLLAWLAAALLSVSAHWRLPMGRLIWNTETWSLERFEGEVSPESLGLTANATLDLQFCMLLHFSGAAHARWVFVTRKHDPSHWLALRRAVYSPAMALMLPPQADALGAPPAA